MARRTHECPVTEEKVLGLGVEGNVGARALSVVVRAGKLCTGGRESTASDKGVGQSGPGSGGGNHLVSIRRESIGTSSIRVRTLSRGCGGAIGSWMSTREGVAWESSSDQLKPSTRVPASHVVAFT